MSGITSVNRAAAESIPGLDETMIATIATGLGLIHVLQVYTSSMVRRFLSRQFPSHLLK